MLCRGNLTVPKPNSEQRFEERRKEIGKCSNLALGGFALTLTSLIILASTAGLATAQSAGSYPTTPNWNYDSPTNSYGGYSNPDPYGRTSRSTYSNPNTLNNPYGSYGGNYPGAYRNPVNPYSPDNFGSYGGNNRSNYSTFSNPNGAYGYSGSSRGSNRGRYGNSANPYRNYGNSGSYGSNYRGGYGNPNAFYGNNFQGGYGNPNAFDGNNFQGGYGNSNAFYGNSFQGGYGNSNAFYGNSFQGGYGNPNAFYGNSFQGGYGNPNSVGGNRNFNCANPGNSSNRYTRYGCQR